MGVLKSSRRGIQAERKRYDLAGGLVATYADRVKGLGPSAYWPLWEASGTVAACQVNAAQNGTYSSDVSGWPVGVGIGDGNTAPGFDGTNDYVDVQTATLETAWNAGGAEWSIMIWIQVANVGVWTDAAWRNATDFTDTINDANLLARSSTNNRFWWSWTGGGVTDFYSDDGLTSVDWLHLVMTRSEAADEVKYYRDAGLLATDTVIGNWASAGAWAQMIIGAQTAVPAQPWHGNLAHCALFPFALSQPQIDSLYAI